MRSLSVKEHCYIVVADEWRRVFRLLLRGAELTEKKYQSDPFGRDLHVYGAKAKCSQGLHPGSVEANDDFALARYV